MPSTAFIDLCIWYIALILSISIHKLKHTRNQNLRIPLIVKILNKNGNLIPDCGFSDKALSKLIVNNPILLRSVEPAGLKTLKR